MYLASNRKWFMCNGVRKSVQGLKSLHSRHEDRNYEHICLAIRTRSAKAKLASVLDLAACKLVKIACIAAIIHNCPALTIVSLLLHYAINHLMENFINLRASDDMSDIRNIHNIARHIFYCASSRSRYKSVVKQDLSYLS